MGSTVTVSRRVSAFRAPNGNIYYAAWETTYEKNCHPHTPHESCVAFGSINRIMSWIYCAMDSCARGMLQGRSSWITPTGYYRMWQAALANPLPLSDREIVLKAGSSWREPIPTGDGSAHDNNKLPFALEKLRALPGYEAKAKQLEAGGQIRLSLHADAEVLADIYGDTAGNGIAPWRILEPYGLGNNFVDPSLAPPKPAASKSFAPSIRLYQIERPEYGHAECFWICALIEGYPSITDYGSVMGTYIRQIARPLELTEYGAGMVAVRAMEAEMKKPLPIAPGTLRVFINRQDDCFKYSRERSIESFAKLVDGLGGRASLTEEHLATTLADLRATGLLDVAMGLTYQRPRFEEGALAAADIRSDTADLFGMAA